MMEELRPQLVSKVLTDPMELVKFIQRVVSVLLESKDAIHPALIIAFEDELSKEYMKKFISDPQTKAVLVQKLYNEVSESSGSDKEETVSYTISDDISFTSPNVKSIVFVKTTAILEADKPITTQVQVMNLNDASPFEMLHLYMSYVLSPYFKSCEVYEKTTRRNATKVQTVGKKLAELEVSLFHVQQNMDLPKISLSIHPIISAAIKKAIEEERKATVSDFGDKVECSTFLDQLQNGVNRWIREIQKITKLVNLSSFGMTVREADFWLNLEHAFLHLHEQCMSPEVLLTLDVLRKGKRFRDDVCFQTETGLKQALATVNDYGPHMKGLPLTDFLSATELDEVGSALQATFSHLHKICTEFPIQKTRRLVETIFRALLAQLLKVLGGVQLMYIPFEEFEKMMTSCFEVFATWDYECKKIQNQFQEIAKKEKFETVWYITPSHGHLQARIEQMRKFRCQHEQFCVVFHQVDSQIEEVHFTYVNMKEVDCLDTSKEGIKAWGASLRRYEACIDHVETRIITELCDQLGEAKDAKAIFRIFSQFGAALVRPRIQSVIRKYQTQLIQRVKDDIESLHEKFFKGQYSQNGACQLSQDRDLPPIIGFIIWAKQIDRQLTLCLKCVEDILGKEWENHDEGRKLRDDVENLRLELNIQAIFDKWVEMVQKHQLSVSIRIFAIDKIRAKTSKSSVLKLRVNCLPDVITLAKEVHNLQWLGFEVPNTIINKAQLTNQLYPYAISLLQSVKTFNQANRKVEGSPTVNLLIADLKNQVQCLIAEGIELVWASVKLDAYVNRLAEAVLKYEEQAEDLLSVVKQIYFILKSLETCAYSTIAIGEVLNEIQKVVDLRLQQYSNLHVWVNHLNQQIEKKLATRLEAGIKAWIQALDGSYAEVDTHIDGGDPQIQTLVHKMCYVNQDIYIRPSVEEAHFNIMQQLFAWENVILFQNRIQCSHNQVGLNEQASESYCNLLTKMPNGTVTLEAAYSAIDKKIQHLEDYANEWMKHRPVLYVNPEALVSKMGEDIECWINTLAAIKTSRTTFVNNSTFDASDIHEMKGPIIVDCTKAQSEICLDYDLWFEYLLDKFGSILGNTMKIFHTTVSELHKDIEQQSIEIVSPADAATFVIYARKLEGKVRMWNKQIELYKKGQSVLVQEKYQFPSSWFHIDKIEPKWVIFKGVAQSVDSTIRVQVASLQAKIIDAVKVVSSRTNDLLIEWEKTQPVNGFLQPNCVTGQFAIFQQKFNSLMEDWNDVMTATQVLELQELGLISKSDEQLQEVLEELQDLKCVAGTKLIWDQINLLRQQLWLNLQPEELSHQLDGLLSQLEETPTRLKQHSFYVYVKHTLLRLTKWNVLIVDMKSNTLKERHWKQLMKQLNVQWVLTDLTLGQVWDIDLHQSKPIIKDLVLVAQGEMDLEGFLRQVQEDWKNYKLDLFHYENKCWLIRGWDNLFNKVKEDINSMAAMKLSPYFKEFEEDALSWEKKLKHINGLFDAWVVIQWRWVYLDRIFSGNGNVKALLPIQTSKFQIISAEFLTLMKNVSMSPFVMDVLNISGVRKSLKYLSESLEVEDIIPN